MKNVVWIWNLIHYNIFRFEVKTSNLINYPIRWIIGALFDIPYIKAGLEKRGSSKSEIFRVSEKTLNNPGDGMNVTDAGIQMGGILVLLEYSLFNFTQGFLQKSLIQYVWEDKVLLLLSIFLMLIPPGIFNYFALFKDDIYLRYFREFNKMPKEESSKYAWVTLLFLFSVVFILIISFAYLVYQM